MGKRVGHVYKHIQNNYPYPSLNKTFSVPPCSTNTTPHVTNGGISASLDGIFKDKPLSSTNTTNKLDNSVNIDNKSQSFSTSRKHNHSAT